MDVKNIEGLFKASRKVIVAICILVILSITLKPFSESYFSKLGESMHEKDSLISEAPNDKLRNNVAKNQNIEDNESAPSNTIEKLKKKKASIYLRGKVNLLEKKDVLNLRVIDITNNISVNADSDGSFELKSSGHLKSDKISVSIEYNDKSIFVDDVFIPKFDYSPTIRVQD